MKHLKNICLLCAGLCLTALVGCDNSSTTTTPSSETKLSSIVFANNDSFPGLSDATFTIDFSYDTALVYNADSLPVDTRIDSVVATFYFTSTIGYARFISGEDTTLITSADTLDFTPRPCYLHVVSEDLQNMRDYQIYVNVHTLDPDLYVWSQTQTSLFSGSCDVHADQVNGTVVLFTQDGIRAALYRSTDGRTWTGPQTPVGLPRSANVRQIISSQQRLYYTENNRLYTSSDGITWTENDCSALGFDMVNMLFYYNDSVWALVADPATQELWFATMAENGSLGKQSQIGPINNYYRFSTEHFPVSDFSPVVFVGRSGRKRAMVMGGFDADGKALNSRWNLEWVDTDADKGFYRLENFTIEQPEFSSLTGAALVWYDDKMMLFGALENGSTILEHPVLESQDEGMNWYVPDSAANMLPEDYTVRQRQAIVVTHDHAILLIGGQNRTTSFTDVWRGKKNSIDWD